VAADVRPASRPAQRLALLRQALQAAAQQAEQLGLGLGECVDEFKRVLQAQGLIDKSKHPNKDKLS
jgi:thioredoxin-like negative regulator of GroEL